MNEHIGYLILVVFLILIYFLFIFFNKNKLFNKDEKRYQQKRSSKVKYLERVYVRNFRQVKADILKGKTKGTCYTTMGVLGVKTDVEFCINPNGSIGAAFSGGTWGMVPIDENSDIFGIELE